MCQYVFANRSLIGLAEVMYQILLSTQIQGRWFGLGQNFKFQNSACRTVKFQYSACQTIVISKFGNLTEINSPW